ncbi:MAG: ATPase, T2SS/T4P/T4SS family [Candidatus Gottesmanbacteria bacterium]
MVKTAQSLADILVQDRVIDNDIASQANVESINTGASVEEIIVRKKLATPEQLAQAKAHLFGFPYVSLLGKGISPDILTYIPEAVARRYVLVPFDLDSQKNVLSVAMADPLDLQVIEFVEKKSAKKIKPFLAMPEEIQTIIEEQYSQSLATEVSAALKERIVPTIRTVEAGKLGEIIREAPIAKIVSTLLEFAVKSRASDIHIEPGEGKTRVRYRIDGILHEKLALPKSVHDAVVSRIKILSNMKIDERRIPQDGRFNFKMGQDEVDLRISTLPTSNGEKVVMRLLKKTGGIPSLPELGLRGIALKNLETAISRPHGIILVTGPTGSGKTTTLYAVLSKLNTTQVNIVTLEDPVEYQIAGVNQVQINPAAGLTFATGLRAFLRQDPNIILVGEVRDGETAGLAIQAALTGHLVFSTLHTNNSSTALPRLLDMNAEPYLIASCLNAVVGQRICRKICPSCKETYDPTKEMIDDFKNILGKLFPNSFNGKFYRGKGCQECNQTGYLGRVGVFEVLPVSEKIARLVLEHASAANVEEQAVAEGMITMKQDGYLKTIEGITTISEVLRVAQD